MDLVYFRAVSVQVQPTFDMLCHVQEKMTRTWCSIANSKMAAMLKILRFMLCIKILYLRFFDMQHMHLM